jgi:hypothetical protein
VSEVEVETNSFLSHLYEFVLLFLYFFVSEETSVGRDVDPDTHFLTFNAIYNTHTHTETMFALQSQIAGAKVVSQVVAKKQQRSTVANAKMAHGKGTLRQRNFVFERRTNHHHKTTPRRVFSLSRLDNSQEKIFLHHCVFSPRIDRLLFLPFSSLETLRAHSRALCFVFHFPE